MSRLKLIISYLQAILLNPDIIHFEFGTLAQKGTKLKCLLNTKLSVSFRGYDLNYAGLDDNSYYTQVWQNFDGFHFLGNDLKKRAIKRGYTGGKIEALISPAVDTDFYKPSETKKNNDKLVIVSVGRLVWKKGYEYGIRAVATLKEEGIPFEYWIIGDGDNLQALQYTIEEFGLQSEVKLQGEQNAIEIKNKLEQAHVFLHPAISEGFSNAVLEAQAMGVPVICTDADGLAENIEDRITGFVVPKWDEKAIADKLLWCSRNKDKLQNMGRAGIERVNKLFRIEDQMDAFVKYYQKLGADSED
jgi:colanic acid/amylovoran biosynthesis glycosyltransferase